MRIWYRSKKKICKCGVSITNYSTRCKNCVAKEKWTSKLRKKVSIQKRKNINKCNLYKNSKTYAAIHQWIIQYHGKAKKCIHCQCEERGQVRFEWALKKGKKYEKKIQNFIPLCVRCHRYYDETLPWQNISKIKSLMRNQL